MVFAVLFILIGLEMNTYVYDWSEVDYALVLGAGLDEDVPSERLEKRLDLAYESLYHRDIPIILTGGQGPGETVTECRAMGDYLQGLGMPASRLILENQATSTQENILYSAELMEGHDLTVAIITSDYHLFRSMMLARRMGWQVVGEGSENPAPAQPGEYLGKCWPWQRTLWSGEVLIRMWMN